MKHYTWTYVGDAGYSAKVGVLHSTKSGHLMVYVNAKIIIIDFNIRDTKNYTFFINDELCELKIERKQQQLFYHFEIDRKTDTPRNKAIKQLEKKHWRQSLLFFGSIGLFGVLLCWFLSGFIKKTAPEASYAFIHDPVETVAIIKVDSTKNPISGAYYFIAENNRYMKAVNTLQNTPLPLKTGDEFIVEYALSNPNLNRIRFDKPSQKQLGVYRNRVLNKHTSANPSFSTKLLACQVDVAFQLTGLDGLADIFYQEVTFAKNQDHNQTTYLQLIRDVPFKKLVEENCWD